MARKEYVLRLACWDEECETGVRCWGCCQWLTVTRTTTTIFSKCWTGFAPCSTEFVQQKAWGRGLFGTLPPENVNNENVNKLGAGTPHHAR